MSAQGIRGLWHSVTIPSMRNPDISRYVSHLSLMTQLSLRSTLTAIDSSPTTAAVILLVPALSDVSTHPQERHASIPWPTATSMPGPPTLMSRPTKKSTPEPMATSTPEPPAGMLHWAMQHLTPRIRITPRDLTDTLLTRS